MPEPTCPTCLATAEHGDALPIPEPMAPQADFFGALALRYHCPRCDGEFLVPAPDRLLVHEGGDPWPTS